VADAARPPHRAASVVPPAPPPPLPSPPAPKRAALAAAQAALTQGRWAEAAAEAAELHDAAAFDREPGIAGEAALVVARAAFNDDRLDDALSWCDRALEAASSPPDAAIAAAAWVVRAAACASAERIDAAIDAIGEAAGCITDEAPAPLRRTVHYGVAIAYRALGLWRQSVPSWRAAVEADRIAAATGTGGAGLPNSRINFVECSLRSMDDASAADAEAASRLLDDVRAMLPEIEADEAALPAGWQRFLSRHVLAGAWRRLSRPHEALAMIRRATPEAGAWPAAARGAVQLELALCLHACGHAEEARAAAAHAVALLASDRAGRSSVLTMPALHDLWRAHALVAGDAAAAFPLLRELHERSTRNLHRLLDKQVAGLTRRLSEQTLRLQNAELREANAGLARHVESIRRLASTDALTGVLNRRALETAYAAMQAEGQGFVVAMIDADHFKSVNDRHSHAVGDEVLRRFAALLAEGLRLPDRVGRYGGEEFMALLAGVDDARARGVAERLRERVAAHEWGAIAPGLSVTCIGFARAEAGDTFDAAVARADALLYRAKREGRNRVVGG
jgi:diguanylate cyclase (GGDEF)-like protein